MPKKKSTKKKIDKKPIDDRPSVMVACVNNSGMRNEYSCNSMFGMGWVLGSAGIKTLSYTFDAHPVSLARNEAVREFLESPYKFTHLFFIDSDSVPKADIILRLLQHQKPVTSGWYLCYSDDTEILTEDGWKLFKDVTVSDVVLTLNPETNKMEWHHPYQTFVYYHQGKMFHQTGKHIDLLVTPNHRLWIRPRHEKEFDFVKASKSLRHVCYYRGGIWEGHEEEWFVLPEAFGRRNNGLGYTIPEKRILMDDWLRFFGIWLAEGSIIDTNKRIDKSVYEISVSQKNYNNKRIIETWIDKCGFHCFDENFELRIRNKQLFMYLRQFGKAKDKFIPRWILGLSKRQLQILLDAFLLGDGKHAGKNQVGVNGFSGLSSNSKQLIDDFQEILLKIGCAGIIRKDSPSLEQKRPNPHYGLSITTITEPRVNSNKDNRKLVDYDGKIYDIEVKNHVIFVRRNGKPCWSSNSRMGSGLPVVLRIIAKNTPKCVACLVKHPEKFPEWRAYKLDELLIGQKEKKSSLVKVDGVGAGCLLIERDVFSKLEKPYFYEDHLSVNSFGEDLWFGLNCKVHRIPIYVDLNALVEHWSWGLIGERHVKALLQKSIRDKMQAKAQGKPI